MDSYEFDQLDFIKIDVEWYEHKVLQGALSTIQKHKPIIYIEIHDYDAYALCLSLGYRYILANGVNRLFKMGWQIENMWYNISKIKNTTGVIVGLRLSA